MAGRRLDALLGPNAAGVLLCLPALGVGLMLLARVALGTAGVSYPNQFSEASAILLWPAGLVVLARLRWGFAMLAAWMAYAAHAMIFGFGLGGPHLTYGVFPALLGTVLTLLKGPARKLHPEPASRRRHGDA